MEIDRLRDDDAPLAPADADNPDSEETTSDSRDAARVGADDATEWSDVEPDAEGQDKRTARVEYPAIVEAVYLEEAREHWRAVAKPRSEEEWADYKEAHPAAPRAVADIDEGAADSVRRGCGEIRETEDKVITPAMRRIEAEDPDRHLVGLEFRRKGEDRIMEKVAHDMQYKGRTSEEALANVKDAIRYTFQYTEEHYTEGVYADIDRLKTTGFELVELRNSWESDQYKGINSRWRLPEDEQVFEVQFHTQISFEAKQLTHPAYERVRNPMTTKAEQEDLVDFQRRVNTCVPNPRDALGIPNYP